MPLAGIIAEFNPLHNGHKYLIDRAKADGYTVACVISGNFVQRGDVAVVPKFARAEMALRVGADIVLELPVPWSMSTAQNFALGGVSQLSALGIDALYFGSECGDADKLIEASEIISSEDFNNKIKEELKSGKTFAKIRSDVFCNITNSNSCVIDNPNDALAVEYIMASKRLGMKIEFKAIKRVGAGHNDIIAEQEYSTATLLRNAIAENRFDYLKTYMPKESVLVLLNSPIADISKIDTAIISRIKQLSLNEFANVADVSEGLDKLLLKWSKEVYSFSGLCDALKSKRYTLARIRRLILSAYLGIDNSYFMNEPPYVRVLGFNLNGKKYINGIGKKPVITKVSQISALDDFCKKVFDLENNCNMQYALSLNDPIKYINEFQQKIIVKE